ncbi:hypothetical protein B0T14DRAFT_568439 [Immersiella caudata]|uniref:Uncharacterized protein n=1 Tax=Immersiella caudata TaxID=314043 RepID=A0AA40BX65_9PEZI|nr:hypothetical protein B0T14DRAFT_568439 [Immersiella caudata]
MMIDGRGSLPSFIFPRCVLDGKGFDECRSQGKGNHTCMPEELTICTSLLHMLFTKTPASSRFVWESIYAYQQQLRSKIPGFDVQELVAALQTMVVLVLVQALDTQSELAQQIHECKMYQALTSSTSSASPSRRDWVFCESARRCLCVLSMIELVFEVIFTGGTDRMPDCGGYAKLPLPTDRTVWEEKDNPTWAMKFCDSVRSRPIFHSPTAYPTLSHLRQVGWKDVSGLTEGTPGWRQSSLESWNSGARQSMSSVPWFGCLW